MGEGTEKRFEFDDLDRRKDKSPLLDEALVLPSVSSPCSGSCGGAVLHHEPALREEEKVYCLECGTAAFGALPPSANYIRVRPSPVERVVALLAERFENKFGKKPSKAGVDAYRIMTADYPNQEGLPLLVSEIEKWKKAHPKRWTARHLLPSKDDHFEELRAIMNGLLIAMTEDEATKQ